MMNKIIHEVRCPGLQNYNRNNPSVISNNVNQSRIIPQVQPERAPLYLVDNLRMPSGQRRQLIKCPKCNKEVDQENLSNHKINECEAEKIPCEFCQTPIISQFYQDHAENCLRNPEYINPDNLENIKIPCENCGQLFKASLYELHAQSCVGRQDSNERTGIGSQQISDYIVCEICGNQVISRDFNYHMQSHALQNTSSNQNQPQQANLPNILLGNNPSLSSFISSFPGSIMMTMAGPGGNFMSMSM